MRRRLLVSTLVVAVTAVLLLGIPLAFVLSRLQISAAGQQVKRDATTVAKTLQDRVNAGLPADVAEAAAAISLPDRYISIRQDGLHEFSSGDRPGAGARSSSWPRPGTSRSPWRPTTRSSTGG